MPEQPISKVHRRQPWTTVAQPEDQKILGHCPPPSIGIGGSGMRRNNAKAWLGPGSLEYLRANQKAKTTVVVLGEEANTFGTRCGTRAGLALTLP